MVQRIPIAWRKRVTGFNPNIRCCWVCGHPGGLAYTTALRDSGYHVGKDETGYAHLMCMMEAQAEAFRRCSTGRIF
jgi:hypothetical protein